MKQGQIINKLLASLLVISIAISCGQKGSKEIKTESNPNSLKVDVRLSVPLAASSMITTSGGTITAQGADGTKYMLILPDGALNKDETITITPISSIVGLNFSGEQIGGVQMAPEGLRLLKPAILTIESPKVVASTGFETVAFGYNKNGEDLYLNHAEIKGNLLTIEVWHFSGEAAAQATPAEIQAQYNQYVPSNEENAFNQRVCEFLGRERQAEILGLPADPTFMDKWIKFIREEYDKFVAPLLPVALTDCDKAPAILSRALSFARKMAIIGWNETEFKTEFKKIMETYEQVLIKCADPSWSGTSSVTVSNSSPIYKINAEVTWVLNKELSSDFDAVYNPEGKLTLEMIVTEGWPTPATHTITHADGELRINSSTATVTYSGTSSTQPWPVIWKALTRRGLVVTGHGPAVAGGSWFFGEGSLSSGGNVISGTKTMANGEFTYTYKFVRTFSRK